MIRVGSGVDFHKLIQEPFRPLMLAGMEVKSEFAFLGHSDADVLLHAVADALLGAAALGDIAKAKGMSQIARETGLGRESLYKSLSAEGNPEFDTIMKVINSLGLQLHASPSTGNG